MRTRTERYRSPALGLTNAHSREDAAASADHGEILAGLRRRLVETALSKSVAADDAASVGSVVNATANISSPLR